MRPNEVTLSQLRRGLPEIRQRGRKEPDEKNIACKTYCCTVLLSCQTTKVSVQIYL